jgi:VWFA-related protein
VKKMILFLLAAAAATAQTNPAPPAAQPAAPSPTPRAGVLAPVAESARVDITNIEVVVTDSKGNRVRDLAKEDFDIRQDGIPQPVTNFYAVDGMKVTFEDGKTIRLDSPEGKDETPREVKARYILYIDNLNIQPQNRNRMFKSLKEFVMQTVGSRAEAEVITYNRSLKTKQRFTNEAGMIVGALEDIERETGGGTSLVGERRDSVQRINEAQSVDEATQIARTYARSLVNDIQFDVDAIKSTLNSLAGIDGRKVFLYVSEGLPSSAGYELFDTIQRKFQNASSLEQFEFDLNSKYTSIVQTANAQGVTIWALDASGLSSGEFISAENRTMDTRPNEFFLRQNTQGPIQMMAEQTGGMAAVNTNDWKRSLDELSRDFTSFYSLGYRSARSGVDKPHSIEVSVKRKGLRVRYRKSLLEKTPETRVAETVMSALDYSRDDNPLAMSVRVDPSEPYQEDTFILPVRIVLPIGKLGLLPSGDRYEGTYIVYIVVRDSKGDKSDLQVRKEGLSVPAKELSRAQTKDHPYELRLVVRSGAQRLSLAVRDLATNQVSYFQKNFFVSVLPPEKKKAS